MKQIKRFFHNKPFVIAGPCSAESESQLIDIAKNISSDTDVFRAGIWKPRTNADTFSGVGEIGLSWLNSVKKETGLRTMTEVATTTHVEKCLKNEVDMLWIGARTTVNPFYIQEISEALKGVNIPVFIKNPIHPELDLWVGAFERLYKNGILKLAAIHRGFFTYNHSIFRNDPKWEIPIKLKEIFPNLPIVCDPSHISGKESIIQDVSQIAMDLSMDGLMIEVHNNPKIALTDANQQINPKKFHQILKSLILRKKAITNQHVYNRLTLIRREIDAIDSQIVQQLCNRKNIVKKIADFKSKHKLTIFQIERWYEILKNRKKDSVELEMNEKMLTEIYEVIHKYSVLFQTELISKN